MVDPPPTESPDTDTCSACADGIQTSFGFSMAFQPIVDAASARVFAYEALVRGPTGEPALSVLRQVTRENRYAFDQSCRRRAVELAAQLGMAEAGAKLSINFMPGAMYSPKSCVRVTLAAAKRYNFPSENIIFELTEDERIHDFDFVRAIFGEYRNQGFSTAIDDFGAGYAALNLLAEYHPDLIKLDMALLRGIDHDSTRWILVDGTLDICRRIGIEVIAEGVETIEEYKSLRSLGVTLFQGYLIARPEFETLPRVRWEELQG